MKTYTKDSLQAAVESNNAHLVTRVLCEEPTLQTKAYKHLCQIARYAESQDQYDVVNVLYAFAGQAAPDDAAIFDVTISAQPISEPIYYNEAVNEIFKKKAHDLKASIIEKYEFEKAQHQLYILTGVNPEICIGTIRKDHIGKHLRWGSFLERNDEALVTLTAILRFFQFNINFGVKAEKYHIAFDPADFERLNFYFTGKILSEPLPPLPVFHLAKCSPGSAIALQRFMFDPKTLEAILDRNNGNYDPENLMLCFAHIMLNANPWFDALRAQGYSFIPHQVTPDPEALSSLSSSSSSTYIPLASARAYKMLELAKAQTDTGLDQPGSKKPRTF